MAVLLVFFFIVIIGMVFYVNLVKDKFLREKDEQTQIESINVMKRALSLPELQCSEQNIIREGCIDILKLESAQAFIRNSDQNQLYYHDLFGFSEIKVMNVYPITQEYEVYTRPLEEFTGRSSTNTPVSLLDPRTGEFSFGIMSIVTYSR